MVIFSTHNRLLYFRTLKTLCSFFQFAVEYEVVSIIAGDVSTNGNVKVSAYNDVNSGGNDDNESYHSVEESDSSEDEV